MNKYDLPDEIRHYLDAILHSFVYPNRINNIRGEIESVVKSEHGDCSEKNILRLYFAVTSFLSMHGFGHDEDYVYIIDKKGMDLKACGSLAVFEATYLQ